MAMVQVPCLAWPSCERSYQGPKSWSTRQRRLATLSLPVLLLAGKSQRNQHRRLVQRRVRPRCEGASERSEPSRRSSALTVASLFSLSPGRAGAEETQSAGAVQEAASNAISDNSNMQRLLGDSEVLFIRQLQKKAKLVETRSGKEVSLAEALKPGEALYDADMVCVGEIHTSEADHAVQRLLVDALNYTLFLELRSSEGVEAAAAKGRTPQIFSPQKLAVGVEYFTRQQQEVLDDLIFNKSANGPGSSPKRFREASSWDQVWSYDWDIYAPLFRFAQLNLTRIVGLNIPYEVTQIVSKGGVTGAPGWLQEELPGLDLSNSKHRRRFEDMLRMPIEKAVSRMQLQGDNFQPNPELNTMYQAQVLWDECMAESARRYLDAAGGRLVVLAGTNHCWRDAIPARFERQAKDAGRQRRAATVVPWRGEELPPDGMADYIWRMPGPGGGDEIAAALKEQRRRLKGQPRVFPAGYI